MAKSKESLSKEGKAERGLRFLRNINVVGALALVGAAVVLPAAVAPVAGAWAGINAVQAGGYEMARQHLAKKRVKKAEDKK